MSNLTREEKETIILFNEAEPDAEVFTYNRALQKKLSGLCNRYPEQFSYRGDNGVGGKTYTVPKKRVNVTAPRTMTPEQKEKAKQNLK